MTDEEKAAAARTAPCATRDALCAAGDWCSIGGGVLAASMMGAIPSQREPLLGGHRFFFLMRKRATSVRTHFVLSEALRFSSVCTRPTFTGASLSWRSCWRSRPCLNASCFPDLIHTHFLYSTLC